MTFSAARILRRGEVYWVSFDPSIGGEIQKTRPAVIVSNDASNAALNRVQVIPISRKIGKLYPSEAFVTLKGEKRKAMADQLTTASRERLRDYIGRLSPADVALLERAILTQLNIRNR